MEHRLWLAICQGLAAVSLFMQWWLASPYMPFASNSRTQGTQTDRFGDNRPQLVFDFPSGLEPFQCCAFPESLLRGHVSISRGPRSGYQPRSMNAESGWFEAIISVSKARGGIHLTDICLCTSETPRFLIRASACVAKSLILLHLTICGRNSMFNPVDCDMVKWDDPRVPFRSTDR